MNDFAYSICYDEVKYQIKNGVEELIPAKIVQQLLAGENPIRVWREYRQLSQAALAQTADISSSYLSQLETGKRNGTVDVLGRIATALNVDINDLTDQCPRPNQPPFTSFPPRLNAKSIDNNDRCG